MAMNQQARKVMINGGYIFILCLIVVLVFYVYNSIEFWNEKAAERNTCDVCMKFITDVLIRVGVSALIVIGAILTFLGIQRLEEGKRKKRKPLR